MYRQSNIKNIGNTGSRGNETRGDNTSYEGSTTRAMAIVWSLNIIMNNISIKNVSSKSGNGIALDFIGETNKVSINDILIDDVLSSNYTNAGDGPNPEVRPLEVNFSATSGEAIFVKMAAK